MNAETVRAALAALPCTVARGADRGLPPPTLCYALQREGGSIRLALKLRAALCETNDDLMAQAENALKPLGFLVRETRESEERDTGIKTKDMVMALFLSPAITVEGHALAGCHTEITEDMPKAQPDLGGTWRRAGDTAFCLRVTAPLAIENTAARRLLNAGAEGLPLWAGKNYTAYLKKRKELTDRAELDFILKEDNA